MSLNKFPSSTLIITTYNWPEALELVLKSVITQSVLPNEVIIADDGSSEKTRTLIANLQEKWSLPLIHVWHEDIGFRLAEIRNKAIAKSTSDYIIQIDGDIILQRHFVKNHLQMAKKGVFLTGSRVWLNESISKESQKNKNINFNYFSNGIKNRLNTIYCPIFMNIFSFYNNNIMKVRGCNMSFWKQDLVDINGYNENMTGWGREDSEICARLINSNRLKRNIKFGAIQYHQHHESSSRKGLNKNDEILEETILKMKTWCNSGLDKHKK